VSSLSAGHPRHTGVPRAGVILVRARLGSEYDIIFSCLFGEKILFCAILKSSSQETKDSSLDLCANFFAYK
jgi:hypothetical protein